MVRALLPTPPPPTTTNLYFSCGAAPSLGFIMVGSGLGEGSGSTTSEAPPRRRYHRSPADPQNMVAIRGGPT